VNPGPDRNAQIGDRLTHCLGASNRSGGTVERSEKPVAGRLDLTASKPIQLEPCPLVVLQKQLAPGGIAKPPELRGRVHNVGEEHGREHAVAVCRRAEDAGACELDCLVRLVPDDRGIVTRRNVVDVVDSEFAHVARVGLHTQATPEDDALVVDLA